MSDEDFLPPFPALHRCLLLDNRQWSHARILREIKGTRYFEQIMDTQDVERAVQLISSHEFDACFAGPTLNKDEVLNFLGRIEAGAYSEDCARICLVYEECDYVDALIAAGAHGVIEIPCGRPILRLGIVRAVVAANVNSAWTGILLSMGPDDIPEEALGKMVIIEGSQSANKVVDSKVRVEVVDDDESDLFGTITVLGAKSLFSGSFESEAEVRKMVEKMVKKVPSLKSVPGFDKFLNEAITAWSEDSHKMSKEEAAERFRKRLVAFSSKD